MSRKQEDLERADRAWQDWLAFIDQRTAIDHTIKGAEGWTLPQAMAHISRWQEWAIQRIQHLLDGGERDAVPVEENNEKWTAEDAGISFAAAFQRNAGSALKLRAKVDGIPDERWDQDLHDVLEANTWEHYAEHMAWH